MLRNLPNTNHIISGLTFLLRFCFHLSIRKDYLMEICDIMLIFPAVLAPSEAASWRTRFFNTVLEAPPHHHQNLKVTMAQSAFYYRSRADKPSSSAVLDDMLPHGTCGVSCL